MQLQEVLRNKPDHVVTLPPSASLTKASALMLLERVGAVVVCEGERILGILSERDLAVAIAVRGPDLFSRRVGELMSVVPIATPADSVRDVMRTMTEKRAGHIPVVDGASVVGVVSLGELLRSRLAEKIQENAVLQDLAHARLPA
jgi:CBS domain-containing protein